MTDDAYLFLADASAMHLGVALPAAGELECLETPAVRAWLDAHDVTAAAETVRVVTPEETRSIPDGAERLPIPLGEEELERVRQAGAPEAMRRVEAELMAFRDSAEGRDALLRRALAAGIPPHRVVELTGVEHSTLAAALDG
ncbi:DUF6003 family protein [Streptomyces sp. NPDC057445]|uniref:DUF6003 family protein n=1 Tax=Streptomyces sp. NPDC057445 TaxID=3346136 RepID=UPI0036AE5BED